MVLVIHFPSRGSISSSAKCHVSNAHVSIAGSSTRICLHTVVSTLPMQEREELRSQAIATSSQDCLVRGGASGARCV